MQSESQGLRGSPFSPLARAVMDAFGEGVVIFDAEGHLVFASRRARTAIESGSSVPAEDAEHLMPILARLGGRITPIRVGSMTVGEAVYLPGEESSRSLADQEKRAIVKTLDRTQGRLAETARLLGISRTTLWRRLKTYGLDRDRRGRWMGSGIGR